MKEKLNILKKLGQAPGTIKKALLSRIS